VAALAAIFCIACGSSSSGGGSGGSGASAGSGTGATGGTMSSCQSGEKRCGQNDTIETCESGDWVPGAACVGAAPVCSSGVCSAVQVMGGFISIQQSTEFSSVRLVDQRFAEQPKVCGNLEGSQVCLSGAFRP
jgi:hypothetical protein